MRFAWLCAVSALALSACHRPEKAAPPPPARPQAAGPASAGPVPISKPAGLIKVHATRIASAPAAARRAAPAPAGHTRAATGQAKHVPQAAQRPSIAARAATGAAAAPAAGPRPRIGQGASAEYTACVTSANGFTVALANCRSAELARQGARVDRAFDAVLATRSGEARQQLVQDQRAWLGRRDAECQADAGRRRSTDVLFEGSCRIDMTIKRATSLEQMRG